MTCQDALLHLDRLIDDELTTDQAAPVHQHFQECKVCREEYELARKVLRTMGSITAPIPGQDYWSEVQGLVLARTVEGETSEVEEPAYREQKGLQRRALACSVLSVAASIAILFSALLIGSQQQQQATVLGPDAAPVLATADLRDLLASDKTALFTKEHQVRLAQGMLLVGLPGSLGRFAGLPELFNTVE